MKRPIFDTKAIGSLGEAIAAKYLEDQNHIVIQRNYWKKWGEIDLSYTWNFWKYTFYRG